MVGYFLACTGLPALLGRYLPAGDARVRLAPAAAVGLVVTRLLAGREPLWRTRSVGRAVRSGRARLASGEVGVFNDDRVGRALEQLVGADQARPAPELMLGVIAEFDIDTSELPNDSTSISVSGVYRASQVISRLPGAGKKFSGDSVRAVGLGGRNCQTSFIAFGL